MPRVRLLKSETRPAAQPPVCLVCGRPAACHVAKQFVWHPPWLTYSLWPAVFCFFPAAFVILIVGYAQTRRATVETPLCTRHCNYWNWRGVWIYMPIFALLAGVVTFAILYLLRRTGDEFFGWIFLASLVGFVGWAAFALIVSRTTVRAVEITDTDITLAPVSSEYADALRRERTGQRRAPVLAWDDYDPYPRE